MSHTAFRVRRIRQLLWPPLRLSVQPWDAAVEAVEAAASEVVSEAELPEAVVPEEAGKAGGIIMPSVCLRAGMFRARIMCMCGCKVQKVLNPPIIPQDVSLSE